MKRKELLKKALIYSLIGATVAGNVVPAYAYTNSVGNVDETGTVITNTEAESCEVYATLASSFKVTIPKKITLDGGTKKGSYTVDVEGDIGGTDVIKVVPDASVALHSTNLTDVTASISQDKTEWSYDEILANSDKVIGNGLIDASGITAGAWNGTFNFNVEYESAGSETPVTLEAGLYDANGVMLCSWEDSGIDVEMDYSGTSSDTNYYQTATTSPFYVLKNNYPDATKVVIPDSVTSIGYYAFRDCIKLTDITIPDSVTSIGHYAFQNCIGLTSITIPDSVTSLMGDAFNNCTNLTSINVDENNSNYCSIDGALFSKDKTTVLRCPAGKTSFTIPEGVTTIGAVAFGLCTNLTNVTIPDSVTSIGDYAFKECVNIDNITIPEGITTIGNQLFYNCRNLSNITIPSSVTSINSGAFYNCTSLNDVIIPDSVTSIGYQAFNNVPHITYNGTATGSPWGALAIN